MTLPSPQATLRWQAARLVAAAAALACLVSPAIAGPSNSLMDISRDGTLLATDSTAPYRYTWTNVAAGTVSALAQELQRAGISASSVDAATERELQAALDEVMRGRTTFVIAHRLGTIRRADVILVLEGGRIVARGQHEDLLDMSPMYAEVFARQVLGAGEAGGSAC